MVIGHDVIFLSFVLEVSKFHFLVLANSNNLVVEICKALQGVSRFIFQLLYDLIILCSASLFLSLGFCKVYLLLSSLSNSLFSIEVRVGWIPFEFFVEVF